MSVDPYPISRTGFFMLTYTYAHGLSDEHIRKIVELHRNDSEIAVVCKEPHKQNGFHIHALADFPNRRSQQSSNIRKYLIVRIYGNDPTVNRYTLNVKKASTPDWAAGYVVKDENILLNKGFANTWIQEQARQRLRHVGTYKKYKRISAEQFPHFLEDYCDLHGIEIPHDKDSFSQLMSLVQKDGYAVNHLAKSAEYIYKTLTNNMEDFWHNQLRFVTD